MEDKYIIFDILEDVKNMSSNLTYALNEASNNSLYKELFSIFKDVNKEAKELFEFAYNNNWYNLEDENNDKIYKVLNKLQQDLN